ncbi:GntR family transcriptional regulator [Alloscardovia omnicolens]|uniref:GntR family transcriptional regulator n=1 Tax=Alloscardovia omnicolens TaxID=419015 RepID=UPI003A78F554
MTAKLKSSLQLQSHSVAEDLAEKIRRGELRDGERLASESAMSKEFGVARGTVRSALHILKEQNLIITKPGVGSFISYHGHDMGSNYGWRNATIEAGSPTSTQLISIDLIPVPRTIHQLYKLEGDMYRVMRQRINNNAVISLEISYLPATRLLHVLLEDKGLLADSISLTMQAAGLIPVSGTQDATVCTLPKKYASFFTKKDIPLLEVKSANFNQAGKLVEYVVSYLDPHHFSLHVEYRKEQCS